MGVHSVSVGLVRGQGKRYALPNTRIMLHHPSGSARGQASDIHNEARELMRLRNYVNQVLALQTGQPVEKARARLQSLGSGAHGGCMLVHVSGCHCPRLHGGKWRMSVH